MQNVRRHNTEVTIYVVLYLKQQMPIIRSSFTISSNGNNSP